MNILGREYGFKYTVGAQEEIAALCPGHDIKRLGEALQGVEDDGSRTAAKVPIILSTWHERAESLNAQAEGREYTAAPLSWEVIQFLTPEEFNALLAEAFDAMNRDMGRRVETEQSGQATQKKTGAAGSSSS